MMEMDLAVALVLLAGLAFAVGHELCRRVRDLTSCKQCKGRFTLIAARSRRRGFLGEGNTEYT